MVAGPAGLAICDRCVDICNETMGRAAQLSGPPAAARSRGAPPPPPPLPAPPAPAAIRKHLDQYVIGQEHAKKVLSVAVYNHYQRLRALAAPRRADDPYADVELEKSNVLLIGSTGTGKTLLARTLAKLLQVPFSISDATTLTEAGYVGEDVENVLLRLIQAADGDIARAERGIVYIDEIDKIARKTENVSLTRDVSGEGVQQALLKIMEGTVANVPPHGGRKHPQQEYLKIDTQHILFICGGAFVGLEDIVRRRLGRGTMGFHGVEPPRLRRGRLPVAPEDLRHFGLIPEFIGRLPVISGLDDLSEADLLRILTEPKNSMVRQYQKLLAMDGVKLTFEPDALRELAAAAVRRGAGARGLRALLEQVMLDVMYERPGAAGSAAHQVTAAGVRRTLAAEPDDEPLRAAG